MKGDRKRRVKVGSGITEHEREFESIFDPEYLDRGRRGALVPSSVRIRPTPPFQETIERLTALSRSIYAEKRLPDPFAFAHPERLHRPVPFEEACSKGAGYLKVLAERGLWQNCIRYSPAEDHSPLWYASQIAILIVRIKNSELKMSESGFTMFFDGQHQPVGGGDAARIVARDGWELGRLDAEYHLKFEHEADALAGKGSKRGLAQTRTRRRQNSTERYAEQFSRMVTKVGAGLTPNAAAHEVVHEDDSGVLAKDLFRRAETLAKAYRTWMKRSENRPYSP